MRSVAITLFVVLGITAAVQADSKPAPKRVEITVTSKGFEPDRVQVPAGQPVTLAITRKTDRTCAKRVVIQLGDGKKIEQDLPLDKAVEISATFAKKGELRYACGMDMISGVILVQ